MVKLIGLILILSSIISLIALGYIYSEVRHKSPVTGNVVSNILNQSRANLNFFDYIEGIVISYSIVSLIIGFVFLFGV